MYWFSRIFGVLIVLALLVPSWAQDAKDKPAKDKKEAVKDKKKTDPKVKPKEDGEPEEKVKYGGTLLGKLKQMEANSQKDFTLTVTIYLKEPDPGQQQNLINLNNQLRNQIAQLNQYILNKDRNNAIATQNAIAQTRVQIAQTQNLLFRKKEVSQDFELRAADTVKVRSNFPPVEYDDKGNLKRWTAKELKALKGNSKLPGYPAEYDALRPGQGIQVYLAKALPTKSPKGLKTEEPMETMRPDVVMILIVQEAQMPPR
jgi:hypothetical protein